MWPETSKNNNNTVTKKHPVTHMETAKATDFPSSETWQTIICSFQRRRFFLKLGTSPGMLDHVRP